ncbi:hypothetical protein ABZ260_45610, partial [Streptosporangium sp. NPDC006013]|uniref:hypothetical protein n=1 Tax=Streptosporangium sp. NPDC006013 TaxID=3155596 RepID=UPI0033B887E9
MRLFSPVQERAWLEHLLGDVAPGGISLRLRLTGPLDEAALGAALGDLAAVARKAVMPISPVLAKVSATFAQVPLVMNILPPL